MLPSCCKRRGCTDTGENCTCGHHRDVQDVEIPMATFTTPSVPPRPAPIPEEQTPQHRPIEMPEIDTANSDFYMIRPGMFDDNRPTPQTSPSSRPGPSTSKPKEDSGYAHMGPGPSRSKPKEESPYLYMGPGPSPSKPKEDSGYAHMGPGPSSSKPKEDSGYAHMGPGPSRSKPKEESPYLYMGPGPAPSTSKPKEGSGKAPVKASTYKPGSPLPKPEEKPDHVLMKPGTSTPPPEEKKK